MIHPSKYNKQKLKTLCTIDTSDIELADAKRKLQKNHCRNKSNGLAILSISQKNGSSINNKQHRRDNRNTISKINQVGYRNQQISSHREKIQHKKKQLRINSQNNSRKSSQVKYKFNSSNYGSTPKQPKKIAVSKYTHTKAQIKKLRKYQSAQKKHKIKSKQKLKTQYSNYSDKYNITDKQIQLTKTMFNFGNHTKSRSSKSKTLLRDNQYFYKIDDKYRADFFQQIGVLNSDKKQQIMLVRWMHAHQSPTFLMKKTKSKSLKKCYQQQIQSYVRLGLYPLNSQNKYPKNIVKLQQHYSQKQYQYMLYENAGISLDWNNNSHQIILKKILKDNGVAIKYMIKQITKGLNQLSRKGFCHGNLCTQNIIMNISQKPTTVNLEGNIKIGDLHRMFHISEKKDKLLEFEQNLYTPPQIINYIMFQNRNQASFEYYEHGIQNMDIMKQNFDRQLIEYMAYYDQPWYSDIWALGIMILQFLAGKPISIQKCLVEPCNHKNKSIHRKQKQIRKYQTIEHDQQLNQISVELDKNYMLCQNQSQRQQQKQQIKDVRLIDDPISLQDILKVQKNILQQTQQQIELLNFDEKLQSLLIRMLSTNPLLRPSPKQILTSI